MTDVVPRLTRAAFRGLRLLDVPDVLQHLKFQKLRQRYYDLFWNRVAAETGCTIRKWDGWHRLSRHGMSIIARGPELALDAPLTLRLIGDKALTYSLLAEQGFAVPRHIRFRLSNLNAAITFLEEAGRPLVVKPNFGTGGGRGVTTGITTVGALRRAALSASRFDPDLIAETQIEGQSWRLLYLDGRFIDAVRRDPPRVTGDGRSSIAKLIASENIRRLGGNSFSALSPIRSDRECLDYLASQDLSLRSIPAAGETVIVKRAVNENSSAENHALASDVHPATVAACSRLVRNLGIRLAGVDILARDIGKPLGPDNGLVGEINTTPGLHHHDLVATAPQGPSAIARLIEAMFETEAGTIVLPGHRRPAPLLRVAR